MIGQTFGPYRIEAQLGVGGMGVVYRARDTRLGREVALKFLSEDSSAKSRPSEQLLNEARAASALNHPNVAHIYDVGEVEGRSYIAMEYVRGQALSQQIPAEGMPVESVLRYGKQIAAALAHAHEQGVVHRDLKSANVVITPEGHAKVLDFGLAGRLSENELEEVTRSLEVSAPREGIAGTLHYMAPEVLRGQPGDQRSDLWALGVVLHEMATGALPFQGRTGFELTSAILRESPGPLPTRVPPGLRAVIQRCLAKEPGERYPRAGEVSAALEALSTSTRVAAAAVEPSRAWWRRQFVYWTVALVVIVGLAIWKGPFVLSLGRTEIGPRLSTGGRASANAEANEYFDKALNLLTVQIDLPRATELLERAIQLDPRFVEARAWHGYTQLLRVDIGLSNDRELIYRAEEETRKVLEIDPDSGRAHANLGVIHFYRGQMDQGKVELARALQINAKDYDAGIWLAGCHIMSGDYEAANDVLKSLMTLNPLYFATRWMIGEVHKDLGDTAVAIREFEKVLEVDPHNVYAAVPLARAHVQEGHLGAARAALERVRPEDRANYMVRIVNAMLLAAEGKLDGAEKEMDSEVQKFAEVAPFYTLMAAEYYALRRDSANALEWLDRAVRNGDERAEWFQRDPLLASIRNHPRFKQILDSIAFRRQQRGR